MKFSIIINTHNQNEYLVRCLQSCINQTFKEDYEIIVFDTSSNNNFKIIKKFKFKNLLYFYKKKKSIFPVIDQLWKIYDAFKRSRGDIICLLDGDDFFHKNKLKIISELNFNNEVIYHDLPMLYFENDNSIKKKNIPIYKNYFIYKKLINNWPIVYGTSCIFFHKKILENFFSLKNIFKFNYLAVDIKIAIFAQKFYKYEIINKRITYKSIRNLNLDLKYNNIFSKIFWFRRRQQIQFQKYIGVKIFNLNIIITNFIIFILKLLKK